jgi:orotidine-5'-phosphate decarboxylase
MAEAVAALVNLYPPESLGCVVGAKQTEDLIRMRVLLPERLFLVPGIGAQGGSLEAVLRNAAASKDFPSLVINSSRGIIFKDKSESFAKTAGSEAKKLKLQIQDLLN